MKEHSPLARRLRAAKLFEQGWTQARVARELGVARTTAMRWQRAWGKEGRQGLARSEQAGRPRKLAAEELSRVLASLPDGSSPERVANAIEQETGVRYHPGHLWRVLKAWGWSQRFDWGERIELTDPDGNELFGFSNPTNRTRPR